MSLNYDAIEKKRPKKALGLSAGHYAVVLAVAGVVLSLSSAFQNFSAVLSEHGKYVQAARELEITKGQLREIAGADRVIQEKSKAIEALRSAMQEQQATLDQVRAKISSRAAALKASLQKIERSRAAGAKGKKDKAAKIAKLKEAIRSEVESLRAENGAAEARLAESRRQMAELTKDLEQATVQRERASLPSSKE